MDCHSILNHSYSIIFYKPSPLAHTKLFRYSPRSSNRYSYFFFRVSANVCRLKSHSHSHTVTHKLTNCLQIISHNQDWSFSRLTYSHTLNCSNLITNYPKLSLIYSHKTTVSYKLFHAVQKQFCIASQGLSDLHSNMSSIAIITNNFSTMYSSRKPYGQIFIIISLILILCYLLALVSTMHIDNQLFEQQLEIRTTTHHQSLYCWVQLEE